MSSFQNCKLGIDASFYLTQIIHSFTPQELQSLAVNGESEYLQHRISEFLEQLRTENITPIFVFNGIPLTFEASSQLEVPGKQKSHSALTDFEAFDPYDANIQRNMYRMDASGPANYGESKPTLLYTNQRDHLDRLCDQVKFYLDQCNVEYFVAPYLAMAQLAYFLNGTSSPYIDAIYGSTDLLLFGVKKFITSMNTSSNVKISSDPSSPSTQTTINSAAKSSFTWLDGNALLQDTNGLSWQQFIDSCLLCGTAISPTFPQIEGTFLIKSAMELVRMFGSAYRAVLHFAEIFPQPIFQDYLQQYKRAVCFSKFGIVMDTKGLTLPPVPTESVPNDINIYFGTRLPNEIYFYISRGLIPCKMIGALVSGCFSDPVSILEQHIGDKASQGTFSGANSGLNPGRDNAAAVAAVDQRRFVDDLEEIWSQGLNLLTQPLNRFYQARDIVSLHGHNQQASLKVMHSYDPPLYNDTRAWMIYEENLPSYLSSNFLKEEPVVLFDLLRALNDPVFVKKSFCTEGNIGIKNPPKHPLSSTAEIVLSSCYRFLQIRSFVLTSHQLTSWGCPLLKALENCHLQNQTSVVVLFELLRLRQLKEPSLLSSSSASIADLSITSATEFLAKVATFLPIKQRPEVSKISIVDENLLQFYQLQTSFGSNLKELMAMILASVILNRNVDKSKIDPKLIRKTYVFFSLSPFLFIFKVSNQFSLPFQNINGSLVSGFVVKRFFEIISKEQEASSQQENIQKAYEIIEKEFPTIGSAENHIAQFLEFWKTFMEGVKEAENTSAIGKLVLSKLFLTNQWIFSLGL